MTADNAMKLLPCPFCGGEAELPKRKPWSADRSWVACKNDDCMTDGPAKQTPAAAIAAWNRRTNADAFGIQTHAGMVYVAPHQYARFVMTEGGWVVAER